MTGVSFTKPVSGKPVSGRPFARPVATRAVDFLVRNPLLVLLIAMVVLVQIATGAQLNWQNLRGVLLDVAIIAIAAVPCAMIVIAGYIDLSVGSTLALGGVVAGMLLRDGAGTPAAVLVAIAVGALVGAVNGLLTAWLGLSPFIVTLGTLTAVRGFAQLLSPYAPSGFGTSFTTLGVGAVNGIPIPVLIAAVIVIAAGVFLTLTPTGRHVFAVGVNREAAFLSGVQTRAIPFWLFTLSGAAAGLAGVITVARLNSAPPGQLGTGFELSVLAAVLLGGVALTGGEGSMFGVVVGVLFMGLLTNSLVLLGVTTFWQSIASGAALVAAIGISASTHRLQHRLTAARTKRQAAGTPATSR
ncbi:ABC transporter permease [Actinokineospora enzanensis]|uniref:ABC transporter permease n=1 Tax=Actinokineospora enzanensis TaxID=155975 RepID=UPI0003758050|nr:ABC transporter permease [Actinokineospora enzanensis]